MSDFLNELDIEAIVTPIKYQTTLLNDRLSRIKKPLVHNSIEVPKGRAIHLNMLNDIEEENFESLEVLNSIERDRLLINNISLLHKPEGKFRYRKKNLSQYDMKLKRVFKRTRTIGEGDKVNVTNRDLMAFNYKLTFVSYTYLTHRLNKWYKFKNSMSTLVETLNQRAVFEHNLVLLDLPDTIPAISLMNRLMKKDYSPLHIKAFPDDGSKLMFEFWKMFFSDADSIFDGIDPDKRDKIYLVFRHKDKYTYYRLRDIYALSKDIDMEDRGKIGAKSPREAAKLFLLSLTQFKLFTTLDENLLKGMTSEDDDDDVNEVAIDSLLEDIGVDTTDSDEAYHEAEDKLYDEDIIEEDNTLEKIDAIIEEGERDEIELDIREIGKTPEDNRRILLEEIESAGKEKSITRGENSRLTETVDTQLENKFIINGKEEKLGDILDYENLDTSIEKKPLRVSNTVMDNELLDNVNTELDKKYLKDVYHKDIYNAIYGMQNGGVVITDHIVEDSKSYLGESETHTLTIKPLKGKPSTVKIILPKINEDGIYSMSGNDYMLRYQRKDLPIRKTSPSTVLLTSYFGKLFINKNLYSKDDPSVWLAKQLAKDDRYSNIIMKKNKPFDVELSKFYTDFTREISRFKYNGIDFIFDYRNRLSGLDIDVVRDIKKLEKEHKAVYIGAGKDKYFIKDDKLVIVGKDVKELDAVEWFGLDFSKRPNELAYIMILDKQVPLIYCMLYYLGLTKLLKRLNVDKRVYTKSDKYTLGKDEYKIVFSDGYLVVNKRDSVASLLLSGIDTKLAKLITIKSLDTRAGLENLFSILDYKLTHINTIKVIETMFIDNVTKSVLELMKEPTDIHNLLIRACEILVDDNYKNPNNISDNALVRYERISGLVYKTLSKAVRSYSNRNSISKAAITIDPYEVWRAIGDDSSSMLIEDNNPIATIKQRDNVTYLGEFGRSRITMTVPSRIMTPEEVGIISEATPDSGDSGISTYLTHSASIKNVRGMVEPIDISKYNITKALSTANAVHPFITTDD